VKGLTFQGKQDIRYDTVPDPEIISSNDVIVKVELCAICGSDMHVYHEHEKGLDNGTVMGHEFVGEIVERGQGVNNLSIGDKVISPFTTNCGQCYFCRIGLTSRCIKGQLYGWIENGQGLQGAQAEYVRVPFSESTLVKIPEGISMEEGLFLGDIFSTGYFAAHQADIKPDGIYVVLGCGPVGIMAIIGAMELGAEKIFAIDGISERLEIASNWGATPLNYKTQDVVNELMNATDGRGADGVMEVVGNSAAGKLAVELVRPGGIISTVGVCNDQHLSFSPSEAFNKNLTYKVGRCPVRHYIDILIPILLEKKLDLSSIVSHRLKLADGTRGYDIFDKKLDGCLKIVLEP